MFFALLVTGAFGAFFGIDWGSEYIKTSMALAGKSVYVVHDQNGKRLSPAYFAFWRTNDPKNSTPEEDHWTKDELTNYSWAFFDAAKAHGMRFPANLVKGLSPILESEHGFLRRESFAISLRHLIKTVAGGQYKPDSAKIVFGVEPWMTREERFALMEATWLANASVVGIVDSPTASANLYALEKRGSYLKKPKTVLFVDVGASHTWAAVYKFEPSKNRPVVRELSLVTRRGLGGNTMDERLRDLLLKKYAESNGVQIPSDTRVQRRFLEEARKVKELLSLNKEVDARIEDVEENKMLNSLVTIKEFEDLIEDFDQVIVDLYNEAVEKAGLEKTNIDGIEMIGGTSRVPLIQHALLKASGLKKLNRTMNSDEAVALGAGYVGAVQSQLFIVKNVRLVVPCHVNVTLRHGDKKVKLFNETSYLTNTHRYSYTAADNANITIFANGVPMTTFIVDLPNNTSPTAKIQAVFGFTDFTIPNVTTVKLSGDELNLSEDVKFYRPDWALTDEQYNQSFDFVMKMEGILDDRRQFQENFNDYESYIYEIKDKLAYDEEFRIVCNETERERLLEIADKNRKWIDENINNLTSDSLKKHLKDMKDELRDAERRLEHYKTINESMTNMTKTLEWIHKELTEVWPKKKKWMSKETLKKTWENYRSTSKWFKSKSAKNAPIPPDCNPDTWFNQFNVQRQILEFNFNSTNRQKKPAPTPTPTPTPQGWIPPTPTPEPVWEDDAEYEAWLSEKHDDDEDYVSHLVRRRREDPDESDYHDFLRELHPERDSYLRCLRKLYEKDVDYVDYLAARDRSDLSHIPRALRRYHKSPENPEYMAFLNETKPDSPVFQEYLRKTPPEDLKYIEFLKGKYSSDSEYIDHLVKRKNDHPDDRNWQEFLKAYPEFDPNATKPEPTPEVTPEPDSQFKEL